MASLIIVVVTFGAVMAAAVTMVALVVSMLRSRCCRRRPVTRCRRHHGGRDHEHQRQGQGDEKRHTGNVPTHWQPSTCAEDEAATQIACLRTAIGTRLATPGNPVHLVRSSVPVLRQRPFAESYARIPSRL